MADTKAETEPLTAATALSKLESFSRGRHSWLEDIQEARDLLAKYVAQQNRAYVKRLCDTARDNPPHPNVGVTLRQEARLQGWNACADYIEREGGKDG